MNLNNIIVICCIILISSSIVLYNTYTFKCKIESYHNYNDNTVEKFGNYENKINGTYNTTLEAYKRGFEFNDGRKNIYNFYDLQDIKDNSPLLTYGCIMTDMSEDIIKSLATKMYVSYYDFFSVSINDIIDKISEDLDKTLVKTNETSLQDPIYVLIYQAPYLYLNDELIIARHDSINNLKASYEQMQDEKKVGVNQLYTKLYVIYANYNGEDKIQKYNNDDGLNFFNDFFKQKLSKNKLCFIECNGVNKLACGCLSGDNSEYKSKCVELDDKERNYGMIYSLNKMNNLFRKKITHLNYIG